MLHVYNIYVTHMSDVGIWNPGADTLHICFIYLDVDFTCRAETSKKYTKNNFILVISLHFRSTPDLLLKLKKIHFPIHE